MRKILLVLLLILTTTSTYATQMCARRDTTVIPLDATVDVKGGYQAGGSNSVENMWWIGFDYGNIYGINTCLSIPEIQEYVPEWSGGTVGVPTVPASEDIQGRSGTYIASDGTEYDRRYCYCKLTHPMSSQWVYTSKENASFDRSWCASRCYFACLYDASYTAGGTNRLAMFNSIGYGYENIDTNEYDESINLN